MRGPAIHIPNSLKAAVVCMVISALLIAAMGVGHVGRRQRLIRLGYDLTEAHTELTRIQEENRRLRLEKSILTNPERIEKLAGNVGMSQPVAGQVRVVRTPAHLATTSLKAPEQARP